MVQNELRVLLARKNTSAAKLADMNKVCMSFIVNGAALPTREGMRAICKELDCKATDIYDPEELNLNVTEERKQAAQPARAAAQASTTYTEKQRDPDTVPLNSLEAPVRQRAERKKDGHENQERIFFWFEPEEKIALVKAVEGLGYRSLTEWFHEMYRQTLKQYAALKLEGKTLHELIPPLASQDSPASSKL